MGMRHWYNVGLLSGELDKTAYMAQPNQAQILGDYHFYAGLHQDLYGSKLEAQTHYQAYCDLPNYKKRRRVPITQFMKHRQK